MALRAATPSPAVAAFPAAKRAGGAIDIGMRIRRHGVIPWDRLERFAQTAAVDPGELKALISPLMVDAGLIDVTTDVNGNPTVVEEHIGVGASVLDQCASMWERANPSDLERCGIEIADQCAYRPLLQSELSTMLELTGFDASTRTDALAHVRSIGLVRVQTSERLGEPVLYSPHVWGSKAIQIAEFLANLPPNEREVLGGIARETGDRPGADLAALSTDNRLLAGARKVGLIDATRVLTSQGQDRAFGFPAGLDRHISSGSTDDTHKRKLFVAHILFGHRYGYQGTGRISDPSVLVSALINRGRVGPATAIGTDYPLLEAQGIVRVRDAGGGRSFLDLVQKDVAEDSLELLNLALDDSPAGRSSESDPLSSLWVPGASFKTPEQDRANLPEPEAGAEAEVLRSTVEELRVDTATRLREETV